MSLFVVCTFCPLFFADRALALCRPSVVSLLQFPLDVGWTDDVFKNRKSFLQHRCLLRVLAPGDRIIVETRLFLFCTYARLPGATPFRSLPPH